MGFDGRSEKGHGKGNPWTSAQQPERTPRDEAGTAGRAGEEGQQRGHMWQRTDKVMEILRMGSETRAQCHGNTVNKGKNISLYTLWHTNTLLKQWSEEHRTYSLKSTDFIINHFKNLRLKSYFAGIFATSSNTFGIFLAVLSACGFLGIVSHSTPVFCSPWLSCVGYFLSCLLSSPMPPSADHNVDRFSVPVKFQKQTLN